MSENIEFKADLAKTVRYLLAHTFITNAKKPALYQYCRENRNQKKLKDYLETIGYTIEVNEAWEYVQLKDTSDAKNEIETGRNENLYKFTPVEKFTIAVLWQYYAEHMAETNVVMRAQDLRERLINSAGVKHRKEFVETLKTLKYFNLVDYKDATRDEFPIIINPTILNIFDAGKFKELMATDDEEELEENV
jgi:hypothetical protein